MNKLFPNHGKRPTIYWSVGLKYLGKMKPEEKKPIQATWRQFCAANPHVKLFRHATREEAEAVLSVLPKDVQAIAEVAQYSPL